MNLLYVIAMYGMEHLAGVVHRELGCEFQAHGHSFSVFALTSAREQRGRDEDSVEDGIPVHRAVAAGRMPEDGINRVTQPLFKYNRFVTGLTQYTRYLAQHREFDLALVEGAYPFGAIAALAQFAVPRPYIVSVTGGDFIASREAEYGYGRYRTARALMRLTFQRAALVRVTTPLVRENVLASGGDADKIEIAPANLANYSFLAPGEQVTEFRRRARADIDARYNLGNAPLLVCAGRLLPIKGFDDAVRALANVRAEFPAARLVFLGPDRATRAGSYRQQLESLAEALGVRDSITFVGSIDHGAMKTWLAAADIVLVPSILEGMNRVALEAAAVGTPSIVTHTAGIADALAAAGAGVMVNPRQPNALAAAVLELLRDPRRRNSMGLAGMSLAAQFSSARVGAQLVELCERVVR